LRAQPLGAQRSGQHGRRAARLRPAGPRHPRAGAARGGALPRIDQTRQRSLVREGHQGARRRRAAREAARAPRRDRQPGLPLPAPVLPEGVHYPVWIRPVNGASTGGAFKVHDDGERRARLPEVRAVIVRLGRPLQEVMNMVEAPPEIARVGGMGCFVEEPATGHQMTVEALSRDGEVVVYGVIDSISYPGTSSFLRYRYPARVRWEVQERMSDISRRVVAKTGLAQS